jgi:alkanesulfonate monooxygenase SsuD/methylene tetrahydromethanopterin reductase-like flavin-dependent oxidoreductase (luciferase family)
VRVGVFVQVCEADSGRMFGMDEVVRTIERAEELGFDSAWVMDHPFIEVPTGRVSGHDPLIVLACAAARTRRIGLGTLVVCPAFRTVGQLARESAALAAASGGRFVLGLGAGWYRPEFDAFDYPFDHLVGRFEEQVTAVRALLAGGPVTADGRYVRLREAEVLATAPSPPIWVAGRRPRMLRLAARHADGWNLAWGDLDPDWLAEPLAALRAELEAVGRERASFTVSAGISWVPGSTAELAGSLREYEEAGVDLAILSLAEGPVRPTRPEYLERAAEVLARTASGTFRLGRA